MAAVVENEVAVGVANGLADAAVGAEVADDGTHLAHGLVALEEQHHHAAAAAGLGIGGEAFEDVLLEQFLNLAVLGVMRGDDGLGVFLHELMARRKHPQADQVKPGAGDAAAQDAAGAGLVKRVRGDNDVGELLRHNSIQTVGGGVVGLVVAGAAAAALPKILNITVPHVGHLPLMALRPFFMVSSTPSAMGFLALHLTQYPSDIKSLPPALHAPNGMERLPTKSGNVNCKGETA